MANAMLRGLRSIWKRNDSERADLWWSLTIYFSPAVSYELNVRRRKIIYLSIYLWLYIKRNFNNCTSISFVLNVSEKYSKLHKMVKNYASLIELVLGTSLIVYTQYDIFLIKAIPASARQFRIGSRNASHFNKINPTNNLISPILIS